MMISEGGASTRGGGSSLKEKGVMLGAKEMPEMSVGSTGSVHTRRWPWIPYKSVDPFMPDSQI